MKILYYDWNENSSDDMIETLTYLGHYVKSVHIDIIDYNEDASFCYELEKELKKEGFGLIFSFDFFPVISRVAMKLEIPYISWIYDCPLYTLQSKTITNKCNYIFCFDGIYAGRLATLGAVHCYHFP